MATTREKLTNYMLDNVQFLYDRRLLFMPRRRLAKELGCSPTRIYDIIQSMRKQRKIRTAYYSNGKPSIYEI